jgi:Flp pilus assembly protein TadG
MVPRAIVLRDTRGVIAVEFALLLPLMAAMMFGSFTAVRMVRASMKMWNVAQSMGDLVAQQTTVTSAQIADFCDGTSLLMLPFTGAVQVTVASVTYNASGARTVDWQDTSCGNGSALAAALTLGTAYTPNPQDSVIIVQAVYAYQFPPSYILPKSLTFTRLVYTRPRAGTQVIHG